MALYMVIEHFKNGEALPIYRRFREHGRMTPDGLSYVSSWIDDKMTTCYQIMETHNSKLFELWMAKWNDLIDFEVHPVLTSKETAEKIASRL